MQRVSLDYQLLDETINGIMSIENENERIRGYEFTGR